MHGSSSPTSSSTASSSRITEDLHRVALAAARLGTFQWNLATDAITLDDRSREIFGFEPAEGQHADEVFGRIHPDDFPRVRADAKASEVSLSRLESEYRVCRPDGTIRTIASLSDALPGPDGRAERMVGVFVDITERKTAEEASHRAAAAAAYRATLSDALRPLSRPVEIQAEAIRVLGDHLGASRVHYAEMEPDGEHAVVPDDYAPTVPNRAGRYRLADFATLVAECRAGRNFVVEDLRADPRLSEAEKATFAALPVVAIAVTPLVKDGRLVAVLAVHFDEPRAWGSDEIALLEETAERTWAAIEQSRAEAVRTRSEERLQAILETARDYAIFTTDTEGRIETWPKGAQEVFGWTAEEATGQPVDMTFTPEDRSKGAPETERITARTVGHAPDVRWHLRKDGTRVFIEGVTRPLDGMDGALSGFVKVGQDVTARRATEEALRASEARLSFLDRLGAETLALADADAFLATTTRLVGEHMGVSVCAYADMDEDEDGFTIRGDWAAPGSTSIKGHYRLVDFGELAVMNLSAGQPLVVEDNLRELAPEEAATFQSIGIAATICMPLVKEGRLTALMAIHDKVARIWTAEELTLLREVTARSWAHVERVGTLAELRESEARLSRALDAGKLGAWELDLTTRAAWRSPQHDHIFGYDQMLPKWTYEMFLEHVVPEDRADVDAKFQAAIAETGQWDFECRIRPADGELRWIWAQGRVDPGTSGQPGPMKGMVRDITDRKRSEEALRELNDTLETRVAERTAELEVAHEQLRQSQKLEAMGQLTGGVAHDFNNLLTPIIASLDMLLRRGVGSERERRLMDGALQSAERAKVLVQRLLAFARRQPLQPRAVDVREVVSGMAELIASTSGPRINVRVELPEDLPPALADANQLEMAVLNLAVNARDAMPEGGMLTISAEPVLVRTGRRTKLRPGDYVRLSVKDTGIGMDEATLARAVEPFFSTKGIGKGTGLGLSMVHGLAMQLNGGLTITSSPGEGTTIDLWLPISAVAAEEDGQAHGAPAAPKTQGTALLVDDEDLVRMSTADMLMDLGYEVVEASSAEAALRLVSGGLQPDLVVTDHLMPGMSGIELARDLRAGRSDLSVLIISGYAEMDGIVPELPRLTKPFRAAELAASLASLVPDGTK